MNVLFEREGRGVILALLATVLIAGCAQLGGERQGGVQRPYAFNCGEMRVKDLSRWSQA